MGGRCGHVSRNAPFVLSRDRYLVFMTMETPQLRDGTKCEMPHYYLQIPTAETN